MKEYLTEEPRWLWIYWTGISTKFSVEKASYFDERPRINSSVTQMLTLFLLPVLLTFSWWWLLLTPALFVGVGKFMLNLPIRTGIQSSDSAEWGVDFHHSMCWIYTGGDTNEDGGTRWVTIKMPWYDDWYSTGILLVDGTWAEENKKTKLSFWEDKWRDPKVVFVGTHLFFDKVSEEFVTATVRVKRAEWRPYWFQWTKLFRKTRKYIDVDFDKAIGSGKGSYKGGVIGCSYDMLGDETPYETLMRMQEERKF